MHLNMVVANKHVMNFNLLYFYHYKQCIAGLNSGMDRMGDTEVHWYIYLRHVKWQLGFLEERKIAQI